MKNKTNQISIFEMNRNLEIKKDGPLAMRMRPRTLEEFFGQEHIVAEGKLLQRMIKADRLSSMIFFGPPGSGKTTLARIIANTTEASFEQINAVTSGVADIRKVVEEAKDSLGMSSRKTVLFIDEIHRFNKLQQDALLPHVEDGTIILIGATTENPYYEVNSALVSRSTVFKLESLPNESIKSIILACLKDSERGLGAYNAEITEDALEHLINVSDGDARTALNALELAVLTSEKDDTGVLLVDLKIAEDCIQKRAINYDKNGENHYDTISAFIKSMRGSDPNAALHYLAKMIYSGEKPNFIARRIVICASEDVGNADPRALDIAVSAAHAVEMIGMPEGRIILAQAAVYVACAPKSNASYVGIDEALSDIENKQTGPVPLWLRNPAFSGAKEWDYGKGYKYAHGYDENFVSMQFLPDIIKDKIYYTPTHNGYEKEINELMERRKSKGNNKIKNEEISEGL